MIVCDNRDDSIYSCAICIPPISFCFTAPARTNRMMLNESSESRFLKIVSGLKGKLSVFPH
jgi:hypothetical protein